MSNKVVFVSFILKTNSGGKIKERKKEKNMRREKNMQENQRKKKQEPEKFGRMDK